MKKTVSKGFKIFLWMTEGVNDVDMTENRDIPDHPWPYMMEMFEIVVVKKDSW